MFDSKSPVVKITGYIIIGFFAIVIIISFGMPDFMSQMGLDRSTAAIVNGKKIHMYDFLRFRDTHFGELRDEKFDQFIFNQFISRTLVNQNAEKIGFSVTEDRIINTIRDIDAFKTGGRYDAEKLKRYLASTRMSLNELYKNLRQDIINTDYLQAMRMGLALPDDEVMTEYVLSNSTIHIKLVQVPFKTLEQRFEKSLSVSDAEISETLKKQAGNITDPESDKKKIRDELRREKFNKALSSLISDINSLKENGSSFDAIANKIDGTLLLAKPFAPGDAIEIINYPQQTVNDLANSQQFITSLMELEREIPSEVIRTQSNLYVYSIISKDMAEPSEATLEELDQIREQMLNDDFSELYSNYMGNLFEQSKIQNLLRK